MDHIVVFVNILTVTIGFAAIYQGFQVYRTYRFPAVRSFVLYVALYNSVMLLTLFAQYILRNIGSLSSDERYTLIIVVMGFFAFAIVAIEVSFYSAAMWNLSGVARTPRWCVFSLGLVFTGWLAAFTIGCYRYFQIADKRFLLAVHQGINLSLSALFLLIPLVPLLRARNTESERQRRLLTTAGLLLFSVACLDACGYLITSPLDVLVMLVASLILNLAVLLKFGAFVTAFYGPGTETSASHLNLDRLCAEYSFSARERDIIQMILKGKSNKEIEQELFISPHTVKNHVYHIFQKAGVNSRGQLVSMILQNSAGPADGQVS